MYAPISSEPLSESKTEDLGEEQYVFVRRYIFSSTHAGLFSHQKAWSGLNKPAQEDTVVSSPAFLVNHISALVTSQVSVSPSESWTALPM